MRIAARRGALVTDWTPSTLSGRTYQMADMTLREAFTVLALIVAGLTGSATVVGWIDSRYMDAIRRTGLEAREYHLQSELIEFRGVAALYEARLQDNGQLSPSDNSRYNVILGKIQASEAALQLIRSELTEL